MKEVLQTGNVFNSKTVAFGHARKVWRRIEEQLPGGFLISNISDFVSDGIIPAGTALVCNFTDKTAQALKVSVISATEDVNTLGINAFSQEDVPVSDANTLGTVNAIVKGEIYNYALGDAASAIEGMTQKNGLSIRVVY